MKTPSCPRAWQAEAVEDGRLPAVDAASFARHAASCASCTRELRALHALREAGELLPVLTSTPLERRRQRHALLQRANALALEAPRMRWARPMALTLGVCACLALGWLFWPGTLQQRSPQREVPSFRVVTSREATWRTLEYGAVVRLSAQRGHLEIAVHKLRAGQRFLLALPDGELEVKGTRFAIDVDGTHTQRVRVSEGRVALRLRGHEERMLNAGEAWQVTAAPEAAAASGAAGDRTATTEGARASSNDPAPPAAVHARSVQPRRGAAQAGALHPRLAPSGAESNALDSTAADAQERAPQSAATERAPRAASLDFAAAMAAFSAGDYGHADSLFARFERDHPGDARVEDALFLRAVALGRRGDADASRELARSYLRRFPRGLRAPEAEPLAR